MRTLLVYTRDLRVHDHPALTEAVSRGDEIVPFFSLDRGLLDRSPNRARFLLQCLHDLDRSLQRLGARLVVREGDAVEGVLRAATELGCNRVFLTADGSALAARREATAERELSTVGVGLEVFPGSMVVEAGELAPEGKALYSVYSPFHRAWAAAPKRAVLDAPGRVRFPGDVPVDPIPDPSEIAPDAFDLPPGGETPGRKRLHGYLTHEVAGYDEVRNDLAADATSRLSPFLRFGCISPNEAASRASEIRGAEGFVRQLAWRDFYMQLLAHDPTLAWTDLREPPGDTASPPPDTDAVLEAWKAGRTGLPLVDAGMRQLQREGWMHNRARMIVASLLTRRLGVPWQRGERHFARLLADGDPANNVGGWQWVAGVGTDPRRSRSFNPVRQARRFDPDGAYVRRYVSELASAPSSLVFAPWTDPAFLRSSGYPEPVVSVPIG